MFVTSMLLLTVLYTIKTCVNEAYLFLYISADTKRLLYY